MTKKEIAAEILHFCKEPRSIGDVIDYFFVNFPEVDQMAMRDMVYSLMLAGHLATGSMGEYTVATYQTTSSSPELFFAALDAEEASEGTPDDREAIDAAWRAVRAEM